MLDIATHAAELIWPLFAQGLASGVGESAGDSLLHRLFAHFRKENPQGQIELQQQVAAAMNTDPELDRQVRNLVENNVAQADVRIETMNGGNVNVGGTFINRSTGAVTGNVTF